MITSSTCGCGRPADSYGGLCDRCVALQTLGLVSTASNEQIENTYRTLIKVWHPDRFQSDPRLKLAAEEKLKEINAAHDCIVSGPARLEVPAAVRKPESAEAEAEPPQRKTNPFVLDPDTEVPKEVQRILQRNQKSPVPSTLVTSGIVLGVVAAVALIWFSVDAFLSSNQSTSVAWARKKSELSLDLHSTWIRIWSSTESLKDSKQTTPAQATAPSQTDPTPPVSPQSDASEQTRNQEHGKVSGQTAGSSGKLVGAKPYITAGLSPSEVLSILGNPTSSSGEKMFYRESEIDFQSGRVVGWRIDSKRAPLRVKLWPDTAPVAGLTTFGLGSSKSDVIALQGTPVLFSMNEFGYGTSVVFFQNDRVVGWKEDPASVRLKVAR